VKDPSIGVPDINARDKAGWTALHCAASPGHLAIVECLLQNSADPTIPNNDGNLPLHYLSRRGPQMNLRKKRNSKSDEDDYIKILKLLILSAEKSGVDVINYQNNNGETPLHQAAAGENEDAIKYLLKCKASLDIENK
jgi:ankyrin repeat protein